MVRHQTVEQVHVVLAKSAEIEELVDFGVLQSQLGQASCLLGLVALGTRRSEAVGAQVLADVRRIGSVIVGGVTIVSTISFSLLLPGIDSIECEVKPLTATGQAGS